MALAGTLVANLYTGFNSNAWTAWLFFAVSIGLIVEWLYTVRPYIFLFVPFIWHCSGYLFCFIPKFYCNTGLWKQSFSLHFCILLVIATLDDIYFPGASLSVKSMEIHIRSRRSRNVSIFTKKIPKSRPIKILRFWTCAYPFTVERTTKNLFGFRSELTSEQCGIPRTTIHESICWSPYEE